MARLNVRIRTALFSTLMDQELAYFNATKTGALCHPRKVALSVMYMYCCTCLLAWMLCISVS